MRLHHAGSCPPWRSRRCNLNRRRKPRIGGDTPRKAIRHVWAGVWRVAGDAVASAVRDSAALSRRRRSKSLTLSPAGLQFDWSAQAAGPRRRREAFEKNDRGFRLPGENAVKHPGTVFIVGAGPGNPDLITVRGLTCLREADVVLHDRLVDRRLLEEVRRDAEVINVGKEPGHEDLQQERIEWLMIEKAREGKSVCRLKGGDPFVFGRGGEEARALVEAGIPFEIVPGVSSAIAAPAWAGIPVTHRDHAHSFMVITGSRSHALDSPEWLAARALIKGGGTVVVVMGFSRIRAIVESLLTGKCESTTPVAVVSNGTRPNQECRVGTLGDITDRVADVKAPAIIIIGEVVTLRSEIRWADLAFMSGLDL